MKIALLTSEFAPFSGGIGTYAHELAAAAAADGHDVTLLAPDYGKETPADAALPYRVVRYSDGTASAKGLGKRIKATFRLLSRNRFDLIHAIDWPFFIPVRLARRKGADVVLTVHGTEITYMQAPKRLMILRFIGFWRQGWARWIGNSRYTTDLLLKAFPTIRPADARGIALGVGDGWRRQHVPRDEARAKLGLGPDDLVIVSLGRVVPRKGHADVADALATLPPALAARVKWWVIGPLIEAAHEALLRGKIAALPVETTLFGGLPADEVALRMSAADLFCLPGYTDETGRVEGFGLVFLEAAAFGVPSIATLSGGIPEAVIDGTTGLLVPERDIAALSGAITGILEDDALRARLSDGAASHAAAATWQAVMRETYRPD